MHNISINKIILFIIVGCIFIMSIVGCQQRENSSEPIIVVEPTEENNNENTNESTIIIESIEPTEEHVESEQISMPTTEVTEETTEETEEPTVEVIEPTIEVEPTEPIVESTEPTEDTEPNIISLGQFKLTAYCPCAQCNGQWAGGITATGVMAKAKHTIAVDPKVIPYGSKVIINGHTYTAEDCGGAIKNNRIDIYFDTHEEANNFGVQYAEIFLVVEE